jgi:uncharacterized membrane protein YoaT (DUF817 family)
MNYTITSKQKILQKVRRWPLGWLWVFGLQQAWAALFGGLMLFGIIFTYYVQLPWLTRFDWLFLWAIAIQILMLATRLEKPREVVTIVLFHLVGLGMELFKTSPEIGSWSYQGTALFQVATVPLFSGFMYAAVGSYIARSWRVMELSYTHYPNRSATLVLALAIYINFFTYHYILDVRLVLFALLILLYRRTQVKFRLVDSYHTMPLLVAFVLIALFIWFAENIGTFTGAWLYPEQVAGWHIVSIGKLGSWLLLMVISLVMVECLWARTTTPKSLQSERPRARA